MIDKELYDEIRSSAGNHNLPRAYGLVKIHKDNYPLRIIFSSINSPTYGLSKMIADILKFAVSKPASNIKDSWTFVDTIKEIHVPPGHSMISIDVTALFTNVSKERFIKAIEKRWNKINKFTLISLDMFISVVDKLFELTCFAFLTKNSLNKFLNLPWELRCLQLLRIWSWKTLKSSALVN